MLCLNHLFLEAAKQKNTFAKNVYVRSIIDVIQCLLLYYGKGLNVWN